VSHFVAGRSILEVAECEKWNGIETRFRRILLSSSPPMIPSASCWFIVLVRLDRIPLSCFCLEGSRPEPSHFQVSSLRLVVTLLAARVTYSDDTKDSVSVHVRTIMSLSISFSLSFDFLVHFSLNFDFLTATESTTPNQMPLEFEL
jgi:hypothetical protein